MKKVLAIMASPRKNKNTNSLIKFLLEGISKVDYTIDKVDLNSLEIRNCTGCDYCGHKGNCTVKDDMNILYDKFDKSDIIILAAPLYFNSLNGMAKNMIDRCQRYWSLKYSLGQNYKRGQDRVGIFLSVGGAPFTFDQFSGTIPVIDFFFKAINAEYRGNYFVSNTDKVQIKDRQDIELDLRAIGENLSHLQKFHIQK